MITRIIYTELWQDEFFINLTPEEKLLFIYFLTNDAVNIIHVYRCSPARISADTGVDVPTVLKSQKKFEEVGKFFFKNGYVYLKNADKFERYEGDSNEIAKGKLFGRLSKDIIDWYNTVSDTPVYTPPKTPSINHKPETINQSYSSKQLADDVERGLKGLE